MDEDPHPVDVDLKELMGLKDLKALVHERCGVYAYLRPHAPGGVPERLRRRHLGEGYPVHTEKRAARAGEPKSVHARESLARQALEDGTVLGVYGYELPWLGKGHQEITAYDDGLLVGVGDDLAGLERRKAGPDARDADDRVEHAVHLVRTGKLDKRLVAKAQHASSWKLVEGGVVPSRLVADDDLRDLVLAGNLYSFLARSVDRDADDLNLVGVRAAHVERLGTY